MTGLHTQQLFVKTLSCINNGLARYFMFNSKTFLLVKSGKFANKLIKLKCINTNTITLFMGTKMIRKMWPFTNYTPNIIFRTIFSWQPHDVVFCRMRLYNVHQYQHHPDHFKKYCSLEPK